MKYVLNISLAILLFGCKDSTTQSIPVKEIVIRTDRSSYYFSTETVRDSIFITFLNATDSIVYEWWPEYSQLKTDSGWQYMSSYDGGFHDPPVFPNQSITKKVAVYSNNSRIKPEGEYRFLVQVVTDTLKPAQYIPSNAFQLSYK